MANKVQVGDVIKVKHDHQAGANVRAGDMFVVGFVIGDDCGSIVTAMDAVHDEGSHGWYFSEWDYDIIARAIKPDPAETGETLHEMAKRMCDSYTGDCDGCPIDYGACCPVSVYAHTTSDELKSKLDALRDWASQNPPKPVRTYKEDFFEKHPDAQHDSVGDPEPYLCQIYKVCVARQMEYNRVTDSTAWNKPLGYWEGNA